MEPQLPPAHQPELLGSSRRQLGSDRSVEHSVYQFEAGNRYWGMLLPRDVTVFEFIHPTHGSLHISTSAPGMADTDQYSLGGFRRVPVSKLTRGDYDPIQDAVALAIGMNAKIETMRGLGTAAVNGKLALDSGQVHGGKIVFLQPGGYEHEDKRSREALEWAGNTVANFAAAGPVKPITGQDLGQTEESLLKLASIYPGSTPLNTASPTAAGNFGFMKGALEGLNLDLSALRIAFLGAGKIGHDVLLATQLSQVARRGSGSVVAVEPGEVQAEKIRNLGVPVLGREDALSKADVVVINAVGGSLDLSTAQMMIQAGTKLVCGCENNPFDPSTKDEVLAVFREHNILYIPTEIGGHLGGTAALEDALCRLKAIETFDVGAFNRDRGLLIEARSKQATRRVLASERTLSFEQALLEMVEH